MAEQQQSLISVQRIERAIIAIRGEKVMLDSDLAVLYGVTVSQLNQAVKRNIQRFPADFVFQLTTEEAGELWSIRSSGASRSQSVILKRGQNIKYRPYAFTEQRVAMLSSVLRSKRAIDVNIAIMRAFVKLRQLLASHADLARKLDELEKKYDKQFAMVFEAIRKLMEPPQPGEVKEMGYHTLMHRGDGKSTSAKRLLKTNPR